MKIAVSECLLGVECRHDGSHKRSRFVTDVLSRYVEFIPFCPEQAILGTPRETLSLRKSAEGVRVVGNKTGKEITDQVRKYAAQSVQSCMENEVCGYVFKAKSPSCGVGDVKLYLPNKMPDVKKVSGIHAQYVLDSMPSLPIEDEGRLMDPWLRENFLMQIFAYDAIQTLHKSAHRSKDLVEFHTCYKFLLLSKSVTNYKKLGQIVANHENLPFEDVLESYVLLFKDSIAKKSSIKKVTNVLEHMAGFLKKELDDTEKKELHHAISEFKKEVVPLIVPIKLLQVYAQKYDSHYLNAQIFLHPYPDELGLRSEIKAVREF